MIIRFMINKLTFNLMEEPLWPQVAKVFRDLLENDHNDRIYPTHPRKARQKENFPLLARPCVLDASGPQKREILSKIFP